MPLSDRLKIILSLARPADVLWDVGCDHGYLGKAALESGNWREVMFVDPSRAVYEELKKSLASYNPKSFLILKESFNTIDLDPNKTHTLIVAGFGGKAIIEGLRHLEKVPTLNQAQLVLAPHGDWLLLREYLSHRCWSLHHEQVVYEMGRFYPILCLNGAIPDFRRVSPYGESWWMTPSGRQWREHLLKVLPLHRQLSDQKLLKHLQDLPIIKDLPPQ